MKQVPCTNAPACKNAMLIDDPAPNEEEAEAVECDDCVAVRILERNRRLGQEPSPKQLEEWYRDLAEQNPGM